MKDAGVSLLVENRQDVIGIRIFRNTDGKGDEEWLIACVFLAPSRDAVGRVRFDFITSVWVIGAGEMGEK